jgi:serine/threonine protein kinase
MTEPGEHKPRTPEADVPPSPATEPSLGLPGPVPTYHSVVHTVASLSPKSEEFPPGHVVGDFLIHSILGRGGMATVYLAEQRSTGRLVALKVSANRGSEARTLASLQHPHIVQVYTETVDVVRDRRLLCMQLVPGTSLEKVLHALKDQGTTWTGRDLLAAINVLSSLPTVFDTEALEARTELEASGHAEAACWLVRQLAQALAHAHHQNVLHRDIKPGNVLLDRYGRPLLADFNVSLDPQRKAGARGEIFGGTLDYMAPEHIDAFNPTSGVGPEAVDRRSDIYGLGLILYELLTGELPFSPAGDVATTPETLTRLAGERRSVSLETVRRSVADEALAAVILRCLDPDPARRYPSATDLAQALEDCRQRERLLASLPPLGSAAFLAASPLLGMALAALVPHIIGGIVNISYNTLRIVSELSPAQQYLFGWLVVAYNGTIWPIACWLLYRVVRSWLRLRRARLQGQTLDGATFTEVRREVLRWPLLTGLLSCLCWVPCAVFFPLGLRLLSNADDVARINWDIVLKFSVSFGLSAVISLTYAMIGVRFMALRVLYPDLLVQTQGLIDTTRRELTMAGRNRLALLAGLIPLMAAAIIVFLSGDELNSPAFRILLVSLICLGMLGFMLALWVQEFLDRTVLALRRQSGEEGNR